MESLLTVEQLAEMLNISPKTVRNWVYRREISFVKLNNRLIRFRRPDIEKFLKNGSVILD